MSSSQPATTRAVLDAKIAAIRPRSLAFMVLMGDLWTQKTCRVRPRDEVAWFRRKPELARSFRGSKWLSATQAGALRRLPHRTLYCASTQLV
jgi:hypothetical protein